MIGAKSPWGRIEKAEAFGHLPVGIAYVLTASGGGFFVPQPLLATMDPVLIRGNEADATGPDRAEGWFEEEADAWLVFAQWPSGALPGQRKMLVRTVYNLHGEEPARAAERELSIWERQNRPIDDRWHFANLRLPS